MPKASRPDWYKDAIIYQLHVRSFYDSNRDGIGDFAGLTLKLEYLKDLGVNTIWLLPFYPSPLKDDGYDIADYCNINPIYGDLADFKRFLKKAHHLELRVITELVLNHTSDQHPWFQEARMAQSNSKERNFYVWNNNNEKYHDARIIFTDFETSNWAWDSTSKSYYWHRFYSHQPDLNFESQDVHMALFKVLDFWFDLGVDGMRLDAIPYLYEREGTNCENLPETHQFLKKLRAHIDQKYVGKMLLAEANQWAEETISYFGNDDECHMCFNFPLMPRMFMALEKEDRFPIVDILEQTPAIPPNSQWAIFLRNHDELTLEMVTDEERDFMYQAFASETMAKINLGIRRRLAPLLGNNRRKIELLNGLLFSLPGTPIIYYGDEIGMGDNIFLGDRNGVRTPLQWSIDRNAGFSQASAQQLYLPVIVDHEYHYEAVNIETQQKNANSLLWWTKHLIDTRKNSLALSRGTIKLLDPPNRKVIAYLREYEKEKVLLIANLSHSAQHTELTLTDLLGYTPVEMFGQANFPTITEQPISFSLGAHTFFLFDLRPPKEIEKELLDPRNWLNIQVSNGDLVLKDHEFINSIQKNISSYLIKTTWFQGATKDIRDVKIDNIYPLFMDNEEFALWGLKISYYQYSEEFYILPVVFKRGIREQDAVKNNLREVIAKISDNAGVEMGLLLEAQSDNDYFQHMLNHLLNAKKHISHKSLHWEKAPEPSPSLENILNRSNTNQNFFSEQDRNTVLTYEDKIVIKCLHKVEKGIHPEAEVSRFLTLHGKELPVAPFIGELSVSVFKQNFIWATIHEYTSNKRNMKEYTADQLIAHFENVQLFLQEFNSDITDASSPLSVDKNVITSKTKEMLGSFLLGTELLAQRLRKLHNFLAVSHRINDFKPERITELYIRSLGQSARELISLTISELSDCRIHMSEANGSNIKTLLELHSELLSYVQRFYKQKYSGLKIREHGNLTLDHILFTGRDYVIVDLEGGSNQVYTSRRLKRPPYSDLASLLNSIEILAEEVISSKNIRSADKPALIPWKNAWVDIYLEKFVSSYFEYSQDENNLLSKETTEKRELLNFFLLMDSFRKIRTYLQRENFEYAKIAISIALKTWASISDDKKCRF